MKTKKEVKSYIKVPASYIYIYIYICMTQGERRNKGGSLRGGLEFISLVLRVEGLGAYVYYKSICVMTEACKLVAVGIHLP